MSPRSAEFMQQARQRLDAAGHSLDAGDVAVAASAAYYAMLYAARAALSERDLYARTHSGVWTTFNREFVRSGEFDAEAFRAAAAAQEIRELGDYEAKPPSREQAAELTASARRFLDAVSELIDA